MKHVQGKGPTPRCGAQKHCEPGQSMPLPSWQSNGGQLQAGEAANAGVCTLVTIGAVHATAAPTPMRLSIRRREMSWLRSSGSMLHPPFALTVLLLHGTEGGQDSTDVSSL